MRLSREKLNKLASAATEQLANLKEVEFLEGYDDIRQELRRLLEELLVNEEKLDKTARLKSKASAASFPKARPSGTSSTTSTTTRKSKN